MPKKSASSKKKSQKPHSTQKSTSSSNEPPAIPDNFVNLIVDFTRDLSITFPEFSHSWQQWSTLEMPEVEIRHLFDYCLSVYPQRFFDILYQNEDIFKAESDIDVRFLPGIDFKLLYNCDNVSENTRKAIWKYLQVIMLASINSVKDKADFGDTMNMFDGIDSDDLQAKLADTISSIGDFFKSSGFGDEAADAADAAGALVICSIWLSYSSICASSAANLCIIMSHICAAIGENCRCASAALSCADSAS